MKKKKKTPKKIYDKNGFQTILEIEKKDRDIERKINYMLKEQQRRLTQIKRLS